MHRLPLPATTRRGPGQVGAADGKLRLYRAVYSDQAAGAIAGLEPVQVIFV